MSLSMIELYDFRTADRDNFPAALPMHALVPHRPHGARTYEAIFDASLPGETTYSYVDAHGCQVNHEQTISTPLPSRDCDEDAHVSSPSTIEPFHLNTYPQDRPRNAFEGSRRTDQLVNDGQYYLDSDAIQSSAYQLDDSFHVLEQSRFSGTSTFGTPQHGLYQTLSDPVTPSSDSPSPVATWSRIHANTLESSSCRDDANVLREDVEEDDVGSDKPYARLIWEALMQAPGHRMMLREIYAWFQCNTNKARESGSNGWQNSIRHNLSMNQAFENDKSDLSTPRGQAKKANSVWVLTENAIKAGVQSTTRYRKTGSGKKTHTSRTPAPLRQRSGAKGGRAARRAAKLRRNEQDRFSDRLSFPGIPSPPDSYGSTGRDGTTNDPDFMSIHTPTTPTNDLSYSFSAAFAVSNYSTDVPLFYTGGEDYPESGAPLQHEFVMQSQKGPCLDGIAHFPYVSNPQEIGM